MDVFEHLKSQLSSQDKRIVFPEGEDERIFGAAARLAHDGLLTPILLGNEAKIKAAAKQDGIDLTGVEIMDRRPIRQPDYQQCMPHF